MISTAPAYPLQVSTIHSRPVVAQATRRSDEEILRLGRMLSDPNRIEILKLLFDFDELNVTELCERLAQNQPAVSHHLKLLKLNSIIGVRKVGKHNYYSIQNGERAALRCILQVNA